MNRVLKVLSKYRKSLIAIFRTSIVVSIDYQLVPYSNHTFMQS